MVPFLEEFDGLNQASKQVLRGNFENISSENWIVRVMSSAIDEERWEGLSKKYVDNGVFLGIQEIVGILTTAISRGVQLYTPLGDEATEHQPEKMGMLVKSYTSPIKMGRMVRLPL